MVDVSSVTMPRIDGLRTKSHSGGAAAVGKVKCEGVKLLRDRRRYGKDGVADPHSRPILIEDGDDALARGRRIRKEVLSKARYDENREVGRYLTLVKIYRGP